MAFPPQFLDELRGRLALGRIVGRRVKLTRRGRELVGLCPFHKENTPSFTVSEEKGFFHCFGCGAHGDVVGFVMQADGLGFPEAVERLAGECGLALPEQTPAARAQARRRSTLVELLDAAAGWFERKLRAAEGAAARAYLAERGLDEETIGHFRLGYAPDRRAALNSFLLGEGADAERLDEAGLVKRPDDGRPAFDFFRGRIMFPITDSRGRVIAFGGRALGEAQPKYLNSPESPVFQKGRALYNLSLARRAALEAGTVVVAEGYMDVIALYRAGIAHAVAPLGTALTEAQIAQLWRLVPEPLLCLDGDAAGRRAALRAAERALPLLEPGRSLRFVFLADGADPDSVLTDKGASALREALAQPRPLVDVLWEEELARGPLDTPERRAGLRRRLDTLVGQIGHRTVREHYLSEFRARCRDLFAPAPAAFGQPWRTARWAERTRSGVVRAKPLGFGTEGESARRERVLLATLVHHPELLATESEALAGLEFETAAYDRLRCALLDIAAADPHLDTTGMRAALERAGLGGVLERLLEASGWQEPGLIESFARPEAGLEAAREGWTHLLARHRRALLQDELKAAERALGENMTEEALAQVVALKRQLESAE